MITLIATLIFAGTFVAAFLTIVLTVRDSWSRIAEVMSGMLPSRLPEIRSPRRRVPVTLRAAVVRSPLRAAA